MTQKLFIQTAGIIFSIVAILHLCRILFGWGVEIGGFRFPYALSVAALGLTSYMVYQSFKLSRNM